MNDMSTILEKIFTFFPKKFSSIRIAKKNNRPFSNEPVEIDYLLKILLKKS